MRPVMGERRAPAAAAAPKRRRDPAPSRLGFRLKRLWRSARFRKAMTVWAPMALVVAGAGWALAQAEWRALAIDKAAELREAVAARPEFAVRRIVVRGASPEVAAEARALLAPYRGASSLTANAEAIRAELRDLGWIAGANVRLSAPETLIVTIRERTPVALWRANGALTLIDRDGVAIAPVGARADHPDLPVIAGPGADRAVEEARAVIAAAAGLASRLRGLVRVGERRWNAIFHEGPDVMLPAEGAVDAMGYLAALQAGEDVMGRDVAAIDLRLSRRPTLRLNDGALEALEALRAPPSDDPAGEDA